MYSSSACFNLCHKKDQDHLQYLWEPPILGTPKRFTKFGGHYLRSCGKNKTCVCVCVCVSVHVCREGGSVVYLEFEWFRYQWFLKKGA